MFAVMGITGQVGGAVAKLLLDQGRQLRAIVRNPDKAAAWKERGAEIAVADFDDSAALANAFRGAEGVFVMLPPNYVPSPDFREARKSVAALRLALEAARPPKVVCLSSIGAQQPHSLGLITSLNILETELASLPAPTAFLRAGWFMENAAGDLQSARYSGEIESYLQPADKPFSFVATEDIGTVAARTLTESWTGHRILEIAGPRDYSPNDLAEAFAAALGHQVLVKTLPRDAWVGQFVAQGMPEDRTDGRAAMMEAFNSGWIHFGIPGTESVRGATELQTVIRQIVDRA